jgi:glycosyltransferase involved in cell wall biosynthesis
MTWHQLPAWVALTFPPLPGLRPLVEWVLWRYFAWWARTVPGLTPTPTVADLMARHTGCRPRPVTNGVDLRRFSPTPAAPGERETLLARYGLDPARPVVLYAGRMDPDKRLKVAAEAVAQALRTVPVQWLVAGDGTQRPAVEQHCRALGIAQHCTFTGYVSADGDLPGLYRLAEVLISASEIETQGMTVLEAGASGVPTVAVEAGALPELIVNGGTGFLSPPAEGAAGLAARLVQVLNQPGLQGHLGQGALRMAQRHSIDAAFDAHEAVYRELIENH